MKRKILKDLFRPLSNAFIVNLMLFFFGACAHVATPGTNYSGKINDGIYINPTNTFQVQIPKLYGGTIVDKQLGFRSFRVSMVDDYCRLFAVTEITPDWEKVSFEKLVDDVGKLYEKNYGGEGDATIVEQKKIPTEFGEGLYVRRSYSAGGPCTVLTFADGKRTEGKPPAESATINMRSGPHVYVIETMIGGSPGGQGAQGGPGLTLGSLDEQMDSFFKGFKPLK
jgi:hypothetical protein